MAIEDGWVLSQHVARHRPQSARSTGMVRWQRTRRSVRALSAGRAHGARMGRPWHLDGEGRLQRNAILRVRQHETTRRSTGSTGRRRCSRRTSRIRTRRRRSSRQLRRSASRLTCGNGASPRTWSGRTRCAVPFGEWMCARPLPFHEERAGRWPGDGVRARVRLRPEHVALRRAALRGPATASSCSTTSGRAARSGAYDPRALRVARRVRRGRARDLPRARPQRRGLRRPLGVGDDRRAGRDRRHPSGSPSSSWSARRRATSTTTTTSAGSRRADIDELLDSLASNYLGWSSAMAPAIMGNPDRPELGEELDGELLPADPEIAARFARATFLSDNRADLAEVTTPTLVLQCSERRDRAAARSASTSRDTMPDATLVVLDATGHCPNLSAPEEIARRDRGVPRADRGLTIDHADGRSTRSTQALLDDDPEALYERAPCGYLSTTPDGTIVKVNQTFLTWTGYDATSWSAGARSPTCCTPAVAIYPRDPLPPLLQMQGAGPRDRARHRPRRRRRRFRSWSTRCSTATADGDPGSSGSRSSTRPSVGGTSASCSPPRSERRRPRGASAELARTLQQTLIPPRSLRDRRPRRRGGLPTGRRRRRDRRRLLRRLRGRRPTTGSSRSATSAARASTPPSWPRSPATRSAPWPSARRARAEILRQLNQVVLNHPTERFCTAVVLRLRRVDDWYAVTMSTGGHPPAIVLEPDRVPRTIGEAAPLVGAFEAATLRRHSVRDATRYDRPPLHRRRHRGSPAREFYDEERLMRLVHDNTQDSAEALVGRTSGRRPALPAGQRKDDIAMIALHASGA